MAKNLTSEQIKEGFAKLPLADQIAVLKSMKATIDAKKKENQEEAKLLTEADKL